MPPFKMIISLMEVFFIKLNIWECGVFSGIIATLVIIIISYPLSYFNLITLCDTEYAARFLLSNEGKSMTTIDWVVGLMSNFSLGGIFGLSIVFFYETFGYESKVIKILGIGVVLWFFHLVIVPFLDPQVAKYSTPSVAIGFFIFYIIFSLIVSLLIFKYLKRSESI